MSIVPKQVPFDFVIDRLSRVSPTVKPMFGCHAIYVGEKIVMIVRKKEKETFDNGVWIAIAEEHQPELKTVFPSMRPIRMFGDKSSSWRNLPEGSDDFEESAMRAAEMVLKRDPRIGKIPKKKKKKAD